MLTLKIIYDIINISNKREVTYMRDGDLVRILSIGLLGTIEGKSENLYKVLGANGIIYMCRAYELGVL